MSDLPRLYVFNLSHFSEKARWACERKGLRFQLVPLLPGLPGRLSCPCTRPQSGRR